VCTSHALAECQRGCGGPAAGGRHPHLGKRAADRAGALVGRLPVPGRLLACVGCRADRDRERHVERRAAAVGDRLRGTATRAHGVRLSSHESPRAEVRVGASQRPDGVLLGKRLALQGATPLQSSYARPRTSMAAGRPAASHHRSGCMRTRRRQQLRWSAAKSATQTPARHAAEAGWAAAQGGAPG